MSSEETSPTTDYKNEAAKALIALKDIYKEPDQLAMPNDEPAVESDASKKLRQDLKNKIDKAKKMGIYDNEIADAAHKIKENEARSTALEYAILKRNTGFHISETSPLNDKWLELDEKLRDAKKWGVDTEGLITAAETSLASSA